MGEHEQWVVGQHAGVVNKLVELGCRFGPLVQKQVCLAAEVRGVIHNSKFSASPLARFI